jgi:hypothetical protein
MISIPLNHLYSSSLDDRINIQYMFVPYYARSSCELRERQQSRTKYNQEAVVESDEQ